MPDTAREPLRYQLSVVDPVRRLLGVTLRVPASAVRGPVILAMPAWTPGSYLVREYSRNVESVEARARGKSLPVRRVTKDRWEIDAAPRGASLDVTWRVYGNELSVRTNHVDDTHAFVQPTATFLCPVGEEARPVEVTVRLPRGWDIATSLQKSRGSGHVFHAPDQESLHDQPLHLGHLRHHPFEVRGVPHEFALWGSGNEDPAALVADMARIVEAGARLFGGLPYERYCIHGLIDGPGGGGLEHRDGFVFQAARTKFRPRKDYDRVLSLLSHEFFHAWNVRRIRPAGFLPYDLSKEAYTSLLWQFEGVTSYYAGLLLRRAGLWTPEKWLQHLGEQAGQMLQFPGRALVSVAESSLTAWVKLYRPDENTANTYVSYYLKGELVGMALDLHLRARSNGTKSYDDVMRLLWERHGTEGVPEDGMVALIEEATGVEVGPLHDALVRGTDDPDWERLLAPFGVRVKRSPAAAPEGYERGAWSGAVTEERAGRTLFRSVRVDGPAAGRIAAGDELVALDGFRVDHGSLPARLADAGPGATVRFTLLRGDRLIETAVTLTEAPALRIAFEIDGSASPEAVRLRDDWLRADEVQAVTARSRAGSSRKRRT